MTIIDVVDLYRLIGGDFLSQLFASNLTYIELYNKTVDLLLTKSLCPCKHEFIRFIISDLVMSGLIKRTFWTGKYELTFKGRQKVITDILESKEEE